MKQLQVKKHMMTAISYLIPFVCAAGMLMVIGNIAGGTSVTDFSKQLAIPDLLTTLGGQALGFLPVVIFNRNRIFYCGQSRYCTWCYHGNSL
mgnify:CR=1 FL=1